MTLAILVYLPRVTRRVPAPLVALPFGALVALFLTRLIPGIHIATIANRFQTFVGNRVVAGIPQLPPLPVLPWRMPGADGAPFSPSLEGVRSLLPGAFAVANAGGADLTRHRQPVGTVLRRYPRDRRHRPNRDQDQ